MSRGSAENLHALWHKTLEWERQAGIAYYGIQHRRMERRARQYRLDTARVAAAFCALSPNTDEESNYIGLDTCLRIVTGELPVSAPVRAYPLNKFKAICILRGATIDETLSGRKVYSFYRNTMDPEDGRFVTVDGHMLGAWAGKRFRLRRDAGMSVKEYRQITEDFQEASECYKLSAPKFQATLWLAWKRTNGILYNPQSSFDWESTMY